MTYIKKEPVTIQKLVCHHPQVEKFWEWGGASINPTHGVAYNLSMIFKDESRKDFKGTNPDEVLKEAEEFLSDIPE